jgi:hypothetical protein
MQHMITADEIADLPHEVRTGLGLLPPKAFALARLRGHRIVWADIDARGWSPGESARIEAAKSLVGDPSQFSLFKACAVLDTEGLEALIAAIRRGR